MTVDELRHRHPGMFTHPELKPNEVCIGFVGPEIIHQHLSSWHQVGVPSARRSKDTTPTEFDVSTSQGRQKMVIRVPAILADAKEYCEVLSKG